ncbi:MAG: metallophosphoesterase [Bacteroidales bacterium]
MRSLIILLCIILSNIMVKSFAQVGIENIKICVFSDPHYFDTSLLVNDGPAFQQYLIYDRKLLIESQAITESLIDSLITEQPDIVLVSGDLTKDGELVCHQKMAAHFAELEANGAKVFVCPGNHDINNPHAVAFDGDTTYPVASVTPEGFKNLYNNFGFNEAISIDTASLSYIVEPIPGLQILSMDICRYDSNYIDNYPNTSGGYKPQVLQWAKDRIIDARSLGKVIIAMQHHNMVEHFTNQKELFTEYVIDDWESVYTELADLGLKVVLTGHFHAQDIRRITTAAGNTMHDVETGSTVTWPCPYRILNIDTDTVLTISGKKVENINFDTGSINFQDYALQSLEDGLPATIIHYLTSPPYSIDQGTAEFVEPAFTETMIAHYAGNEGSPSFNTSFIIFTLNLTGYGYIADALQSAWNDFAPDDWNTTIDLTPNAEKIALDLAVLLEGPFNATEMQTNLNPNYIPLDQPYKTLPWLYTGTNEINVIPNPEIVDWILVEIRDANSVTSATPNTKIGRQAAFLLNDGSVVGLDGTSFLQFHCSVNQQLYAVIYHRNHLPVISAFSITESNGVYDYNFSSGENQAFGGNLAQKEISTGLWSMIAGDGNADGLINMDDKTSFWSLLAGKMGYLSGDYNMDGNVNNEDKNDYWYSNLNMESQVPEQ